MTPLADYIRTAVQLRADELNIVLAQFTKRAVSKDRFVLQKGEIATQYYFIESGALRVFYDDGERQVTGWVALEGYYFTDLASYRTQKPSQFSIQAIEDTILWTIKREKAEWLYQQVPQWQQFTREIWENAFLRLIDGFIAFQTMTAEERYLAAMHESDLLQRLPLKDLSSFLGITPNSLSRIRKNIR
ncbi:Crp/Fnr family transcriptional regulator [Fibrella aquatilis]|uniref:Crp/Fnr family transcriptional regulator n=1 Tax=Fibrella aquatilis TaxID=2817059 RepID=A0A939JYD0_9BACT|nr:Crp/Fnr family transcriptional regulator [Fibrella aquatilis]MBO0931959.1 Crp/Fnr family transcriptional regulator [Fibrella aquatilis]